MCLSIISTSFKVKVSRHIYREAKWTRIFCRCPGSYLGPQPKFGHDE